MVQINPNPDKIIKTTPNKATRETDVRGLLKDVEAKMPAKHKKKTKKAKKTKKSQHRRR